MAAAVELLRAVSPFLPAFLDPERIHWCERAAERVPLGARSHYLECRPGNEPQVDFMSSFDHEGPAPTEYRATLGEEPRTTMAWSGNMRLLDDWKRPGSVLSQAPYLWFEYDAPEHASTEPGDASPSIGLEPRYYARHATAVEGVSPAARPLIEAALPLLVTAEKLERTRRAVARCLDALPPHGGVGYLSVMLARQPVTAKLYMIMPRSSVRDFLVRCEWPGDIRTAEELVDGFYAPAIRTAYVDVTITDRVEPRLGLALSQFHRRELGDSPEKSCLRGLPTALRPEAAELERWPGASLPSLGGVQARLTRWLDFKAVLQGERTQYKAYLGFMRRLRPI